MEFNGIESSIDNFNGFAEFYDAVYSIFTKDLEFWLNATVKLFPDKEASDIEILELGSGTGRVTTYLAKKGFKISGIEISEKMREICLNKFKGLPDNIQDRVTIYPGDMRDFDLSQEFDLIICPGNTFPCLISQEDRGKTLKAIYKHLKKGGFFIVDIWQHDLTTLNPGWNLWDYETVQKFYPALGESVFWCEHSTIEKEQAIELVEISITQVKGNLAKSFSGRFYLKLFTKEELEQELVDNSFVVEMIYGDYGGELLTENSSIMNFVAKKV
jgi:SAM-dependent methyltransferase